jgi:hypothetical protein
VRNVVSTDGLFTCYLTYSSHYLKFWDGKGQIFLAIFKKNLGILTNLFAVISAKPGLSVF